MTVLAILLFSLAVTAVINAVGQIAFSSPIYAAHNWDSMKREAKIQALAALLLAVAGYICVVLN